MDRKHAAAPRALSARSRSSAAGVLFVGGGLASALVATSGEQDLHSRGVAALALMVLAVMAGAWLLLAGHRTPLWGIHGILGCGPIMVALGITSTTNGAAAMAVAALLPLCSVGVIYYFEGLPARLHVTFQLMTVAASLHHRGIHWGVVGAMMVTHLLMAVTIGYLFMMAARSLLDSLTGLPNRRSFDEHLASDMLHARRTGESLSIAMIDVDHFKDINDSEGHAAGDALLQRLARAWGQATPDRLTLCRHGGDEFALLAPGYSAGDLERLSERLRVLAAPASISVGVAQLDDREEGASLIRRADAALYAAKAAGRSCTRSAQAGDEALSTDLAVAIQQREVTVALQPIVRPADRTLIGVEALARWCHHERGWVAPGEFISLAERTGQMSDLGRLVLQKACRDALLLSKRKRMDFFLTVNASGRQLVHPGFVEEVIEVLRGTPWPAHKLVIEVTESTVEIASPTALANLMRLRELGVKVAIDDFGTGYSSFSHLDTLPADYLKLDAAFTGGITSSARRKLMLENLLDLSAKLGLTVIAEGVENIDHADLLTRLKCPLAQGYFYAKPKPVTELLGEILSSAATSDTSGSASFENVNAGAAHIAVSLELLWTGAGQPHTWPPHESALAVRTGAAGLVRQVRPEGDETGGESR